MGQGEADGLRGADAGTGQHNHHRGAVNSRVCVQEQHQGLAVVYVRAAEATATASCSFVANQDYDRGSSGPLPDVAAASADDCCAKCAAYDGCWAGVFAEGQGRCYFKTQNQTQTPGYNDGVTGCWPAGRPPPPNPNGNCHVPRCDNNYNPPLCSDYYHDQEQTPGYPSGDGTCAPPACDTGTVPVGEYLFDPRAANVSINGQTYYEWYRDEYLFGPTGACGRSDHLCEHFKSQ
jgi:hypothetical protein